MSHITLIDDEENITTSLKMTLESAGYDVSVYHDGESGYNALIHTPPDLAVLDIKMPRMDGLEVLRKLRNDADSSLPVIMLTSKDDEEDELEGFDCGADDYVTKPFSQKLLLARIQVLLKRQQLNKHDTANGHGQGETADSSRLIRGDLVMDESRYLCSWRHYPINLTVTEFLLLKALAEKPGLVKTRDQLIDYAYGEHIYVDDRTIDSHIKRIRKKFKKIDPDSSPIETLYGAGYKYSDTT
jgi:two-component system, OmpR family, response regulator ChvI